MFEPHPNRGSCHVFTLSLSHLYMAVISILVCMLLVYMKDWPTVTIIYVHTLQLVQSQLPLHPSLHKEYVR